MAKYQFDVPSGFVPMDASEVWTDGERIVVLGSPEDLGSEGECIHNCDQMGCSSVGPHVLASVYVDIDQQSMLKLFAQLKMRGRGE